MDATLDHYLEHLCGVANVQRDAPLSQYTTWRVGGTADYLVTVPDKNTLCRLISALTFLEQPYFILGLGANVLASDHGYRGVVVRLGFRQITHNDEFLYADAGATLGSVIKYARDHGLTGLEWATGIPASVGGATYMNCGAFGHSFGDAVVMVDVLDQGVVKTLTARQLAFGYRHSRFMDTPQIILGVYLRLDRDDPVTITARMNEFLAQRAHHPKQPSAGSVFKRPRDDFNVGATIERLGLKGFRIGDAMVSPEHANFIVNLGHATAHDIDQIIDHVQDAVADATGVLLTPEIIYLGEFK